MHGGNLPDFELPPLPVLLFDELSLDETPKLHNSAVNISNLDTGCRFLNNRLCNLQENSYYIPHSKLPDRKCTGICTSQVHLLSVSRDR